MDTPGDIQMSWPKGIARRARRSFEISRARALPMDPSQAALLVDSEHRAHDLCRSSVLSGNENTSSHIERVSVALLILVPR